ncbi:MAG: hypothetical protein A2998_01015 [Candidatus Staskawiczbacteria bacterium RIFCSPLOWO2_01_FULL_37_25b]|uniref:Uncharacterized protein n=2 Tax=Candidatus Staskawicziibacteriota TaxID=1817916 RepID=A0A1G2HTA1_9BACT|nr:MAG: hypothetical protein A2812_03330 [Candidatus Staskawiczbacteria bacterium RIFCSPHIGHO2_01_FULL_36_16]OGZ71641.1 MAG: hypothetical protein A2998_01015 [Candidatus Staskawiczbacteria bacterium RIFCSPLOWO2_01_FULL_37_25b]
MLDDKDVEKLVEVFATKEDLKELVTKNDFDEFKDKSLSKLDKILEGIVPLKEEKTIKDEQDMRQKKVLEIHNNALKKNKILSEEQVSEIDKLRVF